MSVQDSAPVESTGMDSKLYPVALVAWLWVLIPFGWGLYKLFDKIGDLF